jgi:hypothetical protein
MVSICEALHTLAPETIGNYGYSDGDAGWMMTVEMMNDVTCRRRDGTK